MTWFRKTFSIAGDSFEGFIRDSGGLFEASVPFREIPNGFDILVADMLDGSGDLYRVLSSRNPGDRNETLELTLAPVTDQDAAPAEKKEKPLDRDERLVMIEDEIRFLNPDDSAHWTVDGKPDATVLSERLGWAVGKKDRDQAFKSVQAAALDTVND